MATSRYYNYVIVMAAVAIANIVKSSLGPLGLDKMLVDDVGVSVCWVPDATCTLPWHRDLNSPNWHETCIFIVTHMQCPSFCALKTRCKLSDWIPD